MNNNNKLTMVALQLVSGNKGLLAMDESIPTCNKRFRETGIPETAEYRKRYRELIVTTPGLERFISGAILSDETFQQKTANGDLMTCVLTGKGIIPGIKVDKGTISMPKFPGDKVTEGLDGLRARLESYHRAGARFAKWRAVATIGTGLPGTACMRFNAQLLAQYAAECQVASLVPIVEPEVLMDGSHSIETCNEITREFLHFVFDALYEHKVDLTAILLKPNMILPGNTAALPPAIDEVATMTLSCFMASVPAAVPGIVLLSGGQTAQQATERLNAIKLSQKAAPWQITFSYSRAILQPVLQMWKGSEANITVAQDILLHRSACNHMASAGLYTDALETTNFELIKNP